MSPNGTGLCTPNPEPEVPQQSGAVTAGKVGPAGYGVPPSMVPRCRHGHADTACTTAVLHGRFARHGLPAPGGSGAAEGWGSTEPGGSREPALGREDAHGRDRRGTGQARLSKQAAPRAPACSRTVAPAQPRRPSTSPGSWGTRHRPIPGVPRRATPSLTMIARGGPGSTGSKHGRALRSRPGVRSAV